MDARTLEALKASIEKWERNARVRSPQNYRLQASDCPLCDLFFNKACIGCPVMIETGADCCDNSPYRSAVLAHRRWMNGEGTVQQARAAAREEVAFLKSLLPVEGA